MKTRWLVLSLALVAVAAVAAVVFSSQGSAYIYWAEQGHPVPAHGVFWNRDYGRVGKDGQLSHSKGRPFYGLLVLGLGLTGAFHFQKKSPPGFRRCFWGQPLPPPMSFTSPLQAVQPW